jgi:hypothetical protein
LSFYVLSVDEPEFHPWIADISHDGLLDRGVGLATTTDSLLEEERLG